MVTLLPRISGPSLLPTSAVYKHCLRPTNCSLEDGTQHILVPLTQLHNQMVKKPLYSYIRQAESTYKLIVTKVVVAYLNTYPRSLAKELKKHNRQHERKKVSCCFSTIPDNNARLSYWNSDLHGGEE
jgi:hypothetical protein